MAVHFKFKSAKNYDTISFAGNMIGVLELKKAIVHTKKLDRGLDFDLIVTNAQSGEVYDDENAMLPKNTSVLVKRVPVKKDGLLARMKTEAAAALSTSRSLLLGTENAATSNLESSKDPLQGESKDGSLSRDAAPVSIEDVAGSKLVPSGDGGAGDGKIGSQDQDNDEEEEEENLEDELTALQAVNKKAEEIRTQKRPGNLTWTASEGSKGADPLRLGSLTSTLGRGKPPRPPAHGPQRWQYQRPAPDAEPPEGYVCYRCGKPGHFIQYCPTNSDSTYDQHRVKKRTGIPTSFMKQVTEEEAVKAGDGKTVVTAPWGGLAVIEPRRQDFDRAVQQSIGSAALQKLRLNPPMHLACPICKKLLQDAVMVPCCQESACDGCIRSALIDSDMMCPLCGAGGVTPDKLLPNKQLRISVEAYLSEARKEQIEREKATKESEEKVKAEEKEKTSKAEEEKAAPASTTKGADAVLDLRKGRKSRRGSQEDDEFGGDIFGDYDGDEPVASLEAEVTEEREDRADDSISEKEPGDATKESTLPMEKAAEDDSPRRGAGGVSRNLKRKSGESEADRRLDGEESSASKSRGDSSPSERLERERLQPDSDSKEENGPDGERDRRENRGDPGGPGGPGEYFPPRPDMPGGMMGWNGPGGPPHPMYGPGPGWFDGPPPPMMGGPGWFGGPPPPWFGPEPGPWGPPPPGLMPPGPGMGPGGGGPDRRGKRKRWPKNRNQGKAEHRGMGHPHGRDGPADGLRGERGHMRGEVGDYERPRHPQDSERRGGPAEGEGRRGSWRDEPGDKPSVRRSSSTDRKGNDRRHPDNVDRDPRDERDRQYGDGRSSDETRGAGPSYRSESRGRYDRYGPSHRRPVDGADGGAQSVSGGVERDAARRYEASDRARREVARQKGVELDRHMSSRNRTSELRQGDSSRDRESTRSRDRERSSRGNNDSEEHGSRDGEERRSSSRRSSPRESHHRQERTRGHRESEELGRRHAPGRDRRERADESRSTSFKSRSRSGSSSRRSRNMEGVHGSVENDEQRRRWRAESSRTESTQSRDHFKDDRNRKRARTERSKREEDEDSKTAHSSEHSGRDRMKGDRDDRWTHSPRSAAAAYSRHDEETSTRTVSRARPDLVLQDQDRRRDREAHGKNGSGPQTPLSNRVADLRARDKREPATKIRTPREEEMPFVSLPLDLLRGDDDAEGFDNFSEKEARLEHRRDREHSRSSKEYVNGSHRDGDERAKAIRGREARRSHADAGKGSRREELDERGRKKHRKRSNESLEMKAAKRMNSVFDRLGPAVGLGASQESRSGTGTRRIVTLSQRR